MKKLFTELLSLSACMVLLAACAQDDPQAPASVGQENGPTGKVNFRFETKGLSGSDVTRTVSYTYGKDNFRIFAFKKLDNGDDYVYLKEVPLDGMSYAPTTSVLSGTADLPIGEYKFVPTYNLTVPGGYSMPDMNGQPLRENLAITHTSGSLPAIYAETRAHNELPSYVLGTTSKPNQTVSSSLKRSVSRIDVLFIRADKDPVTNKYTPKQGDHIFGGDIPTSVTMSLTGLNPSLSITGNKLDAGGATFDTQYAVPDLAKSITMGTGTATAVGTDGYSGYDNVQPADIISGSAHMHGAYVIPNTDNTGTIGLEMVLVPKMGTSRTITVSTKLPAQRNMVTLVTVYVLSGNVFTTNVDYEVTVNTVWDGTNSADTEIS